MIGRRFVLGAWMATSACALFDPLDLPEDVERQSEAQPLGIFSTERPDDAPGQARQALAQDAWRRETRFMNAADPGFSFSATRVDQAEIDAGLWTSDELYQLGGQLFTHRFSRTEGFGAADLPALGRFHLGRRGGPDAHRCADCHWRGGLAGAGDAADNAFFRGDAIHQGTTLVRNPPALPGAGYVELLAAEMSAELAAKRDELRVFARDAGYAVQIELQAKGVSFGTLVADADGELDYAGLLGVDDDLVVKPFGWKGSFSTLRDVVEDALLVHHGMQSDFLVAHEAADRVGDGPAHDPDGDGITHEITEGQVTAMTLFLAMQAVPTEEPPSTPDSQFTTTMVTLYARGRTQFEELGCATCHVPALPLQDTTFALPARDGDETYAVDLADDGARPRLAPSAVDGRLEVRLFSDLKRHHMGEAMAEPRPDGGAAGDVFVTRPLWGVARSRPYLHDGRAPTLEDAILLHGGEAQASRDAFAALPEPERGPLRIFLTSLTRAGQLVTPLP